MRLHVTDEHVSEMGRLAVLASRPMGLGYLHHRADLTKDQIVFEEPITRGLFIDYYLGRMVKFRGWKKHDGWEFPDTISHEYESWISTYPSYQALSEAATKGDAVAGTVDPGTASPLRV